jgi:hypothetical protein
MLFAASESSGLGALIVIGIMALGFRKICTTIKGSDAVKGAAKHGMVSVLGRIFKR